MNKQLQIFARTRLKSGLRECTEAQRHMFRRMYSLGDLKKEIDSVVDEVSEERLDWAMKQVERTLEINYASEKHLSVARHHKIC